MTGRWPSRSAGPAWTGLDIDGAAISLHTASTLRETLFATDASADLLEELQFSLGEGACIEAARTGRPVLVPDMTDTADTSRWPSSRPPSWSRPGSARSSRCRCSGARSTSGCWISTANAPGR